MATSSFELMWSSFPDHQKYPDLNSLFTFIGGALAKQINVPGFGPGGNTCAVRMSRALNYGNFPISSKTVASLRLNALIGADKKLYLFRVRELGSYLASALAVTPQSATANFDKAFSGKRGIVAFTIHGWHDASGHFALWDGQGFKEPNHDDYRHQSQHGVTTTKMMLWPL